ncbi:MAG: ATP-binding protein [candidate division Zixibacteria bacterium]|nr:ATP-binding protein [candidate division Zixibacteria bacterium]
MKLVNEVDNTIMVPIELSENAEQSFLQHLENLSNVHSLPIKLNCSQLKQTTSTHIGLLWQAREIFEEKGIKMSLLWPTPELIRVLKVLNLTEFFNFDGDSQTIDRTEFISFEISASPEIYRDEFIADNESLNKALEKFKQFLIRINLTKYISFDLIIIFYEVGNNICTHGTTNGSNKVIFKAKVFNNRIVMQFEDNGLPFNPTEKMTDFHPLEAAKKRQKRGFGLSIIKKLIDDISYTYSDNGMNKLTLEKRWSNNYE